MCNIHHNVVLTKSYLVLLYISCMHQHVQFINYMRSSHMVILHPCQWCYRLSPQPGPTSLGILFIFRTICSALGQNLLPFLLACTQVRAPCLSVSSTACLRTNWTWPPRKLRDGSSTLSATPGWMQRLTPNWWDLHSSSSISQLST